MKDIANPNASLLTEIRQLIDTVKQRVSVNAELTLLYWKIGQCIRTEILKGERAEYGERVVGTLAQQLEQDYGRGFGQKNLRHMVRFAEAFPKEEIVSTLSRQLAWSHFLEIIYFKEPLARDKRASQNTNKSVTPWLDHGVQVH